MNHSGARRTTAAFAGEVEGSTKSADAPRRRSAARAPAVHRRRRGTPVYRRRRRRGAAVPPRPGRGARPTRRSRRDAGRRTRGSAVGRIRDTEPVPRKLPLLGRRDQPGSQAGIVQQAPEWLRGFAKWARAARGSASRVNAAEDRPEPRRQDVRHGPGRSRFGTFTTHQGAPFRRRLNTDVPSRRARTARTRPEPYGRQALGPAVRSAPRSARAPAVAPVSVRRIREVVPWRSACRGGRGRRPRPS